MVTATFLLLLVTQTIPSGPSALATDAALTTPVGGLERTGSRAEIVAASGHGFAKALRVVVGGPSAETNATQLTLPNAVPLRAGDTMLATLWLRGSRPGGGSGRIELLFERATEPWTKSATQGIDVKDGWRRVEIPFRAAEPYAPGQAMLSIRLAFGPQTVELGGIELKDLGPDVSLASLTEGLAMRDPLGTVPVDFDFAHPRQTMIGLGGNFTQPRYGRTESPDAVGRTVLAHLPVRHARIGLPLDYWTPSRGVYREEGQAAASMKALALLTKRGIPTVVSVWEGPAWLLPGKKEASGRVLDPAQYRDCIEAIVRYLVVARDKYGARADDLSFNEPDYGVNFKFTSATMRDFVRQAGPRLAAAGLKTRFVVGDTAGGSAFAAYAEPILKDPTIAPYLGPLAFHCWDVLSASEVSYRAIAELGVRFGKPVWCLEAGHDSALWQAKDPWPTWDNALRTAMAYERTLRWASPRVMDYWTYENDYPIASPDGKLYPIFTVLKAMERVFAPGSRVVASRSDLGELQALGTVGPDRRFAMLFVNPRGAGKAILAGLPPSTPVQVATNDGASQDRTSMARTDAKGRLAVDLPTRSVVTLVARS